MLALCGVHQPPRLGRCCVWQPFTGGHGGRASQGLWYTCSWKVTAAGLSNNKKSEGLATSSFAEGDGVLAAKRTVRHPQKKSWSHKSR